jgi:hypothetical protein
MAKSCHRRTCDESNQGPQKGFPVTNNPLNSESHSPFDPAQSLINRMSGALSRRDVLRAAGTSLGAAIVASATPLWAAPAKSRPKVAVVMTVCHHRSHAHVLLENFLQPYLFNGKRTDPGVDVVSFYVDQTPADDMSQDIARQFKIPIFKTIAEALCLGGQQLAVDAVLGIGEHGNYPLTKLGQRKYPRKRFFDEIVAVMRRSRRYVPLFNDKHLSYRWDWAKEMYDTAQQAGIPFMAGSSVPLAQRRPQLELPAGAHIEEAISIHGGPLESYDFHGLEVLQSMVESRTGGETGVSSIELLKGDALWKAAEEGRWSPELARAALAAELGKAPESLRGIPGEKPEPTHALLVTYKDGLKATVLKVGRSSTRWNFACRLKSDPKIHATSFYVGPWNNRNLFKALSHSIQHHFIHKQAPYPVERTLLVTGMLEAAMRSHDVGKPIQTPHLEFAYKPRDFTAMREMGASWKIITEDLPEPKGITPHGIGASLATIPTGIDHQD